MADGFKKYFNATTMNGRANVAKATYATLALVYLFYRVRRGKGAPPPGDDAENRYCDPEAKGGAHSEKDCSVCREKPERHGRQEDGCNGHDGPPPPPSSGGNSQRRKCPCEDPHKHVDAAKPIPQKPCSTSTSASASSNPPQLDDVHPGRELIGHMQDAASRVLRHVIGAVMKETAGENEHQEESCSCCTTNAAAPDHLDSLEPLDEDGSDYGVDNQLLSRQRRTAPRACVPTNSSGDTDGPESEQPEHHSQSGPQAVLQDESQSQLQSQSQSQSQSQAQSESQAQSQSQTRYHGFDDDFASEMFFEDYDE